MVNFKLNLDSKNTKDYRIDTENNSNIGVFIRNHEPNNEALILNTFEKVFSNILSSIAR